MAMSLNKFLECMEKLTKLAESNKLRCPNCNHNKFNWERILPEVISNSSGPVGHRDHGQRCECPRCGHVYCETNTPTYIK